MESLEKLIAELRVGRERRDPSPEPVQLSDECCDSANDTWTRLAQLEARLRACTTLDDTNSVSVDAEGYSDATSTPNTPFQAPLPLTRSPNAIQLNWAPLNRDLLLRGFPPLLDPEISEITPCPEAAYGALRSVLRELDRVQQHAESLRSAADEAAQREAAVVHQLRTEARRRPHEEREAQNFVARAQQEAARAKEECAMARQAAQEAATEAAGLRNNLDRLQRQLFSKEAEAESTRQQLQVHLEKQKQQEIAAKESVKRIRHAFATQRASPGSNSRASSTSYTSTNRAATSPVAGFATVEKLPMLQVAKIYETLLQSAENEARVARAEAALLRQSRIEAQSRAGQEEETSSSNRKLCCCDATASNAAREVAEAQEMAERTQEEVHVLQEELTQRPSAEDHVRLQRQTEILTNRLGRLEKERALLINSPSKHPPPRTGSGSISLNASLSRAQHPQATCLPKQVALELIDTMANMFHCRDPLQLPEAGREAQRSVSSVQALRRLVDDICEVVFKQGSSLVPWTLREEDPSNIPGILITWVERMDEAESMHSTLRAIRKQLSRRPTGAQHAQHGDGRSACASGADILPAVAHLVDLEFRILGRNTGAEDQGGDNMSAEDTSQHELVPSLENNKFLMGTHQQQQQREQRPKAQQHSNDKGISVVKIPGGARFPEVEIFAPSLPPPSRRKQNKGPAAAAIASSRRF